MSSNALLWPSQGTIPERRLDKYKYLRLPSQGVGDVVAPPPDGETFRIIAVFPTIADATFEHYKFYQIKQGQAPNLQINMPVVILVDLEAGSLKDLTNGFDIRVFDCEGSPIPYEIIDLIVLGDGSATFEVWLNMPIVGDFEFVQLAFGKDGSPDGSTPGAVYDVNYKGVYHLNGVGTDSTSNALNLTINGTTTVPAKIGNGLDFDGTVNDFLIRNPFNGFPSTEITCEYWVETIDIPFGMVSYAVISSPKEFETFFSGGNNMVMSIKSSNVIPVRSFNDGIFHHIVVTWRSSDGQIILYEDGVNVFSAILEQGASLTDGGSVVLAQTQGSVGGGFNAVQALDGILEEVKISNNIRDADYVETTFNNQNNNDAFWFRTPRLTVGETNFLVDDQARNIVTEIP